jgi:hypothetical protein
MTPSMRLSAIKRAYAGHPDEKTICVSIEQAFALGHEFGVERAADVVDRCNRKGPYNAIGAAPLIRALRIVPVEDVPTVDKDFL